MKTFLEQVADLKATRESHMKTMRDVAQKSVDEGRSMDTAEAEQFDTLEGEIKRLDADIARLSRLAEIDKASAKPVSDEEQKNQPASGGARSGFSLKNNEKLEKGIAFARYAMCLTKAKGDHGRAFTLAKKYYPHTETIIKTLDMQAQGADLAELLRTKAAVAAGTTTDPTWAAPLAEPSAFMGDFIDFLRPRTLIGQAQFEPIPFNVRIGRATSGGTAKWVGQGKAKPLTKFDFNDLTTEFSKVSAIAVLTQELIRFNDMSAEQRVRNLLAGCVIERIDADLFDPDVAAVAGINPASLLHGVAPISVGTISYSDPDSVTDAIDALWAGWDSTNLGARPAYYTVPAVARKLAGLRDALGARVFPQMTRTGGNIDGVPVRVSQYLANNGGSGGAPFVLVDEAEVYLADDGSVTLDARDDVALEMNDAPTSASDVPTGAQMVSMWQTNSVAFRAERFIWWGKRRNSAVQWIDGMPTT